MNISIGIVGLPNVGKSTLFNALTKSQVLAANYPFATIDPNVGIVPVNDKRLLKLSEISKSKETIPAVVEFVDIAGLVKGASNGEGLGNKFLSHIREVAAIVHLVRVFKNENIVHVSGGVNPVDDIATINIELILKDIETIKKLIDGIERNLKNSKEDTLQSKLSIYKRIEQSLQKGELASVTALSAEEKKLTNDLSILTLKPVIYCANVDEADLKLDDTSLRNLMGLNENEIVCSISAQIESELSQLPSDEKDEFMKELGIDQSGLDKLTHKAYSILGLITYFTTGDKESRAWTIIKGTQAPQAAGVIHTDFEHNFISLECISYEKFVEVQSWNIAKDKGYVRLEGKTYTVNDGDIVIVRHS